MTATNFLSVVDDVVGADAVRIYSSANGDDRQAPISVLAQYFQEQITSSDDKITKYVAPALTGFTATIPDNSSSAFLLLTPTGAFAAGTIVLPAVAHCIDKQEILVFTSQAVTALTINGNGATAVLGAPTTLAQNAKFRLRFDFITKSWYCVG